MDIRALRPSRDLHGRKPQKSLARHGMTEWSANGQAITQATVTTQAPPSTHSHCGCSRTTRAHTVAAAGQRERTCTAIGCNRQCQARVRRFHLAWCCQTYPPQGNAGEGMPSQDDIYSLSAIGPLCWGKAPTACWA